MGDLFARVVAAVPRESVPGRAGHKLACSSKIPARIAGHVSYELWGRRVYRYLLPFAALAVSRRRSG